MTDRIIIRGNTFAHREYIKSIGGRWDSITKAWMLDYLSDTDRNLLRAYRLTIEDNRKPKPYTPPRQTQRRKTIFVGDDREYFNYFNRKNPIIFGGFSSLNKLLDYVEPLRATGIVDQPWRTNESAVKKYASASFEQAIQTARNGWSDGLGLIDKLDTPPARSKRRVHSAVGGAVSIGRMLAGNPAHMIAKKPRSGHQTIRLFVDCTSVDQVEPWHEIMRALIVGSMVDRLESEGYRCEIIAIQCATRHPSSGPSTQYTVRLKEPHERLNLMDLTFAFGHPAMCSRILGAIDAQYDDLGYHENFTGWVDEAFTDLHEPGHNEFYVPILLPWDVACMTDDPLSMIPFIEPRGLPISLRSDA